MTPAAVPGPADAASRVRVWDLPTRLFHWSLVVLVSTAFVTAYLGGKAMLWHGRAGIAICGLLAFRIVWGCIGSTHARFANFVRGPAAIRDHLAGRWHGVGHNPLGALSVIAMLVVLLLQALTGLAGNDDITFNGPLYALVPKDLSNLLTELHVANQWLLWMLLILHMGAIIYYLQVKRQNLVRPMIHGWQQRRDGSEAPPSGGGIKAFILALLLALAAAWGASGAWIPAPPPPPAGQVAPEF